MWAKVEGASIKEIIPRPKAMTIGDTQYPHNIFELWGAAELKGLGIYPITIDYTNLKDNKYYINTGINYTWDSDNETVTGAYGTATAKSLTNVLYTAQNESDGIGIEGEVKTVGLKITHKNSINSQANSLLSEYDWYTLRAASGGTAIPSSVATYQAAVRTKANSMCTQIDGAANVDALAALYVYNSDNPPVRPLGEWPSKPE